MQSSPPSHLAKTNPQQRLVCRLPSHLLIFRRQLSSVLGGEERGRQDSLGLKGKSTRGAGHKLGWTAGPTPCYGHTPLQEDSCLRLLWSPVFLGVATCWSPALDWAADESSPGKRSPLVIRNSLSFPGETSASAWACLSPSWLRKLVGGIGSSIYAPAQQHPQPPSSFLHGLFFDPVIFLNAHFVGKKNAWWKRGNSGPGKAWKTQISYFLLFWISIYVPQWGFPAYACITPF